MKLYVRVENIEPFVLQLHDDLQSKHYEKIIKQYYNEKYDGKPPGELFLHKIFNFKNGNKLYEFKRKETLAMKFSMELQLKTSIHEELDACDESITMSICNTEICNHQMPKHVSLNRLILKLTDCQDDRVMEEIFWHNYRSFVTPEVVLSKFLERFHLPLLSEQENYSNADKIYFLMIHRKIQEKIIKLIYFWISNFYFDFSDGMVEKLKEFCQNYLISFGFRYAYKQMMEVIDKNNRTPPWEQIKETTTPNWKKLKASIAPEPLKIGNLSNKEIAEQLTYSDQKYYNEIRFTELLGQAWTKDSKRHMSPNLMNSINFLNRVSSWTTVAILKEEDERKRKKLIKKFIKIMSELKDMNSLNMIVAIHSALQNFSVHRLSTWDSIEEKYIMERNKIESFISAQNNYKALREAMNTCYFEGKPCLPYLGIYLRDLVFVEDGNPSIIDGKINFQKFITMQNTLSQVLRFQGRDYKINPNPPLIQELQNFEILDEETLYRMSIAITPKRNQSVINK